MRVRTLLTPSILAAALALAACASEIPAPSLGPRAVEKQPIDMPVANGDEAEKPTDATLAAQLASFLAAAEAGEKGFTEQRVRADVAISRATGTGEGSDAWIDAQQALTSLDSARGPVRDAAAAIDALRQNPANAAPGNRMAIDQAAARVTQIDDAQSVAFATLAARLR